MRMPSALLTCLLATALASAQDPDYVLMLSTDAVAPGEDAQVICSITNTGGDIGGFSLGICNDPAVAEPFDFTMLPAFQSFNGGMGPDFFSHVFESDGFGCGTVISLFGTDFLGNVTDAELISLDYHTFPNVLMSTPLEFCDTVGSPDLATIVAVGVDSITPVQMDGAIDFITGSIFIRGDSNGDNAVNIADPITTLNYLFQSGTALCLVAMDANGDGTVDIADPLAVLQYINGQGPAPSAPFPNCGEDSTGSMLECLTPPTC